MAKRFMVVVQRNSVLRHTVFMDHGLEGSQFAGMGIPSLRIYNGEAFPTTINKQERDYIYKELHSTVHEVTSDGRYLLPKIIRDFGGYIVNQEVISFRVMFYEVNLGDDPLDIRFELTDEIEIDAFQSKTRSDREKIKVKFNNIVRDKVHLEYWQN